MPIFDIQCNSCDFTEEVIAPANQEHFVCTRCGGKARKIITLSGTNRYKEDAPWIRSVLEVVEKGSGKPHCDAFLSNPTRRNYHNWMKGENIRPMEKERGNFSNRSKKPKTDMRGIVKGMIEKRMQRDKMYFSGS